MGKVGGGGAERESGRSVEWYFLVTVMKKTTDLTLKLAAFVMLSFCHDTETQRTESVRHGFMVFSQYGVQIDPYCFVPMGILQLNCCFILMP